MEAILRFARKVIRQIKLKYLIVAIPEPKVGCLSRKQLEIRLFAVSVGKKLQHLCLVLITLREHVDTVFAWVKTIYVMEHVPMLIKKVREEFLSVSLVRRQVEEVLSVAVRPAAVLQHLL